MRQPFGIVLDFYLFREHRDLADDLPDEFVTLHWKHHVPYRNKVAERLAYLFRLKVLPGGIDLLCRLHHAGQHLRFGEHQRDVVQHQFFQFGGGNALDRTGRFDSFGIPVAKEVPVTFVSSFRGETFLHHASADSAPDQSQQRNKPLGTSARVPAFFLQQFLRVIPRFFVDDRLMYARIGLVVVFAHSDVDGVLQRLVDVRRGESAAAMRPAAPSADSCAGSESFCVKCRRRIPCGTELQIGREDAPDNFGFLRYNLQLFRIGVGDVSHGREPAAIHPFLLCRRHLVPDALGDDLALELGEGDEDVQHHAPGRTGGIDVLRHAGEFHMMFVKLSLCIDGIKVGLKQDCDIARTVANEITKIFSVDTLVTLPDEILAQYFQAIASNAENDDRTSFGIGGWLKRHAERDPQYALTIAEMYSGYEKNRKNDIYDHENNFTQLLALLFKDAEEREQTDNGKMLLRVIELQDFFLSKGVSQMKDWLKDAERP